LESLQAYLGVSKKAMDGIKKTLKNNSFIITIVASALLIANQTGFDINIPKFYNSLSLDGKILFIGLLNVLITIIAMVYVLNKTSKVKELITKKELGE
jgi:hypothetical protein